MFGFSAPRNDSGASLRNTLAGLYGGGVQDVHLVWGEYNEGGHVPPAVRMVLRNFTAAGMRIATHVVGRELWVWKTEERCAGRPPFSGCCRPQPGYAYITWHSVTLEPQLFGLPVWPACKKGAHLPSNSATICPLP